MPARNSALDIVECGSIVIVSRTEAVQTKMRDGRYPPLSAAGIIAEERAEVD